MFDSANTLKALDLYGKRQADLEQWRTDLLNSSMPQAQKDEEDAEAKREIDKIAAKKEAVLSRFASFPPQHQRHEKLLADFHKAGAFDQSVFIMTKFPDPKGNDPLDVQLRAVIKAVQDAVARCSFTARIASEKDYHPILWDNVELFLLGCARGIAIVENRYKPELNPNVAMEWGWMRGMGRPVLYLVEKSFDQKRADWSGLTEYEFQWDDPGKAIDDAVHKWLGCTRAH